MFILRSRSAAHAFIHIVCCTCRNPHLADVLELGAPTSCTDAGSLAHHVDGARQAAEVIAAACLEEPRKGMRVAIDIHDPAIRAALSAMLELYAQFLEIDDRSGSCVDALDLSEIGMTIQAALDLPSEELQHV